MDIKKLNESIAEALDENGINKVVNAIEAELEHQSFQNMGVDVDEGAFEPSVTVFIHWFDEYTENQANLINEKFNVFKTTEHLNGAEVYTESDVNTLRDTDGETKSEGNVSFVALISEDTDITDEIADEIAVAFVQQLTNFWDEVYSEEMLNESVSEKHKSVKVLKEDKESFDNILVDNRYAIYPDGVVYDTEKAEDIPAYVFAIRDKIVGKAIKEDADGYELDAEQQEELNKAIELYKKHGMLFLDDEEGKNAYEVLYNAGYTMKKNMAGDVGYCIELNR